MRMPYTWMLLSCAFGLSSCIFVVADRGDKGNFQVLDSSEAHAVSPDSLPRPAIVDTVRRDSVVKEFLTGRKIDTKATRPQEVVGFSKTLIGIPYRYGSTDPKVGFDCSGFITYVFHHFGIVVPRSSIDFTSVGQTVDAPSAKPGDLILFTGTDSTEKFVGHMGLIVENDGKMVQFIHSTSGKQHGVTITPLSDYYRSRYIKTIRIFPQNNEL